MALCSNIFVDPSFSASQYPVIMESINTAIQTNKSFYGTLQADTPDIIACNSDACAMYFSGSTDSNNTIYPTGRAGQYVAPRVTMVLVSPYWGQVNTSILAHEFSHVELYKRTNGVNVQGWFNEGLATYVGKQFDCAGVPKGIDDLTRLDVQINWNNYTGVGGSVAQATYCQASAEVGAWVAKKGGNAAIVQLLQNLGQGQGFYSLYGPLLTQ